MIMNYKIKKQSGISLIEIMVALVISLFLMGGVIQVFLGNKTTYRFSEALSRVQESGRFSMDYISRDLRHAGFWGCATFDPSDTTNISNNLNPAGPGFDDAIHNFIENPHIEGTENDGFNNSDSVTIRGAVPGQSNIVSPYNSPTSAQIFTNSGSSLKQDDIVLLSNCRGADIFQISNLTQGGASKYSIVHNAGAGSPGNYNPAACKAGHCLSQTYGGDSALMKLQTVTYSIAQGVNNEPTLIRSVNGVEEELAEGVEQLQVLYGVDKDDNAIPDTFVSSDKVTDWNEVTTVRLMLLLKSEERVLGEDQTYVFNGTNITSNDRMLRHVFTKTTALRNKL